MTKKERFTTIWNRHTFTMSGFATEAGVGESVILAMLEDKPVTEGVATHVLATFATLTCNPYSLENVEIALINEGTSEVARVLARIEEETDAMMRGLSGLAQGTS